jgi:hypothetical protein
VLITSKYKGHKKGESKTDAAGRVRHSLSTEIQRSESPGPVLRRSGVDRRSARKGDNKCPVCCSSLPFTGRGGRRVHGCTTCGATYRPDRTCPHCGGARVWQGKAGMYCQGCGHEVKKARNDCRRLARIAARQTCSARTSSAQPPLSVVSPNATVHNHQNTGPACRSRLTVEEAEDSFQALVSATPRAHHTRRRAQYRLLAKHPQRSSSLHRAHK